VCVCVWCFKHCPLQIPSEVIRYIVSGRHVFLASEKGQIMKQERQRETTRGPGEREREEREREREMEGVNSEGKPKPAGCC